MGVKKEKTSWCGGKATGGAVGSGLVGRWDGWGPGMVGKKEGGHHIKVPHPHGWKHAELMLPASGETFAYDTESISVTHKPGNASTNMQDLICENRTFLLQSHA